MTPVAGLAGDKEWFGIAEACRLLQIPPYTLRYWEARFNALRPTRLAGGHRRYSKKDLDTAFKIRELLRERKLTIEGARKVLAHSRRPARLSAAAASGPGLDPSALKLLRRVREDLQRLLDDLSR